MIVLNEQLFNLMVKRCMNRRLTNCDIARAELPYLILVQQGQGVDKKGAVTNIEFGSIYRLSVGLVSNPIVELKCERYSSIDIATVGKLKALSTKDFLLAMKRLTRTKKFILDFNHGHITENGEWKLYE